MALPASDLHVELTPNLSHCLSLAGIAREVAQGAAPLTTAVQGTPAFMAPEQAEGRAQAIG